ncbi:gamma carbonic anhydrase family protein [Sphaerisporangium album]|uniref:Gamma carbonic anhydrase family protein n=1 Tax=Sphaerisporangium album TaxID=509200 RepID=A0A367F986_9ACTN|nr:gamma carbonic anhydrase family protein [Sphaerisporangium album]RCG26499.1 gamma carbonic anhydrase family protein [Sphaerisporangium album]
MRGTLEENVPRIDPRAWLAPGAIVVGNVTIGRGTSVWYGSVLRGDDDAIVVGEECNVQDMCCLHADRGQPCIIEDRVSIGHKAVVHGAHVAAGSLIGIGAIVLGGARIGAGSMIAAGALVGPRMAIPPGVLVAGAPGRVVRKLTDGDRAVLTGTADSYVELARRHQAAKWDDLLSTSHP